MTKESTDKNDVPESASAAIDSSDPVESNKSCYTEIQCSKELTKESAGEDDKSQAPADSSDPVDTDIQCDKELTKESAGEDDKSQAPADSSDPVDTDFQCDKELKEEEEEEEEEDSLVRNKNVSLIYKSTCVESVLEQPQGQVVVDPSSSDPNNPVNIDTNNTRRNYFPIIKKRFKRFTQNVKAKTKMKGPNDLLEASPDFSGPVEKRHFTDIFWLVLISLSWIALTIIGIVAFVRGDYRLLVYPMDYEGNLCGIAFGSKDMTDFPFLYYVNFGLGGVCIDKCPSFESLRDEEGEITKRRRARALAYYNNNINNNDDAANITLNNTTTTNNDIYTLSNIEDSISEIEETISNISDTITNTEEFISYIEDFISNITTIDHHQQETQNIQDSNSINFQDLKDDNGPGDMFTLITYAGLFQLEGYAKLPPDAIRVGNYSTNNNNSHYECTVETCFPGVVVGEGGNNTIKNIFVRDSWMSLLGVNFGFGSAFYALDSEPFLGRCIPTSSAISYVSRQTGFGLAEDIMFKIQEFEFFEKLYSDLWKCVGWILGIGGLGTIVLGFLYSTMMQIPHIAKTLVWISVYVCIGMFFGIGSYLLHMADQWETTLAALDAMSAAREAAVEAIANTTLLLDSQEIPPTLPPLTEEELFYTNLEVRVSNGDVRSAKIFGIFFLILGTMFSCVLLFIRKELKLSIACMKEASKAISHIPLLVSFPIFEAAIFIGFLAIWIAYSVFLAGVVEFSTVQITNPINRVEISLRKIEYSKAVEGSAYYLLFSLFWTYQFIGAMGQIIIAMTISKWYFTRDKPKNVGNMTLIKAICASMVHIGTAAFGSLVIAIVNLIRWFFTYIHRKVSKSTGDNNNSRIGEALALSCLFCTLVLEKFLQFISKNAYIHTAIFGTSFYTSSVESFYLIARNAYDMSTITYVTTAMSLVGRISITSIVGVSAYFLMAHHYKMGEEEEEGEERMDDNKAGGGEVHSLSGPTVLTVILSYFIADVFMSIFDMTVTTILHCFIADEEMFYNEDHNEMYAEGDLRELIDTLDTTTTEKTGREQELTIKCPHCHKTFQKSEALEIKEEEEEEKIIPETTE